MPKINILDSKIYNRISAGEVVERPFSVVKELVENSIDAGADNILIEVVDGGETMIKVTDNGSGIEKAELKSAVLPHATSKIANVDDLDNILTLGFRGEALASIASVSKLKIISKPKEQEFAAKIEVNGGEIGSVEDCPLESGTEITVQNLFYNTPARQKFLKTPKSEEGDISNLVTRFILGNPNLSIKYIANGKTIYQSYADGISEAMINIYGSKIIDDCFYIDAEKNGVKIKGYIGKHYYSKPNRTYQSIFLNNRYIINATISSAISNAYGPYLMKRQYPFYVLALTVPPLTVDVNVHPNKTDVRFSNNQVIYGALYSIITKVLDGTSDALNIVKDTSSTKDNLIQDNNSDFNNHKENSSDFDKEYDTHRQYSAAPLPDMIFKLCDHKKGDLFNYDETESKDAEKDATLDIFAENKKYLEELDKKAVVENDEKENTNSNNEKVSLLKFEETEKRSFNLIGQALNTYLIFDDGKDMFFIDQHAAHERILFDKYILAVKNKTLFLQPLLAPFILNVNNEECEFITDKLDYFVHLGIEIEQFGFNTFKINAIPTDIVEMNLHNFFDDILNDIISLKKETVPTVIYEKIAQKACKAAIKGGDKLTNTEIIELIEMLDGNLGLKCPHGRPICITIKGNEIEKWFKRIV